MKVAIIVPMRNEAANIGRTLRSIQRAAEAAKADYQIIVVDNGSDDEGPRIAAGQGVQVIVSPGSSVGALRNLGASMSEGEVIAFVDADMEMPECWLQVWFDCFRTRNVDLLALVHVPPPTAPWYARVWGHRILAQRAKESFRDFLPSTNFCMTRRCFDEVGGFDVSLRSGEDKDLTLRLHAAGFRLLSLPSPVAIHWGYERNFAEWVRKEFWRQSSHADLLAKAGYRSPRLLRFPMAAMAHWATAGMSLVALAASTPALASLFLGLGLIPSLWVTVRHPLNREFAIGIRLCFLHWLRFHIGGMAFIAGLLGRWRHGGSR